MNSIPELPESLKKDVKKFKYITELINLNKLSSEDVKSLKQNSYDVAVNLLEQENPQVDFRKDYPYLTAKDIRPILVGVQKDTGFYCYVFYFAYNLYDVMVVKDVKSFNQAVQNFAADGFKRSLEARVWLESPKTRKRLGDLQVRANPMAVVFMDGMEEPAGSQEFSEPIGMFDCIVRVLTVDAQKDKELLEGLDKLQKDLGIPS